MKPGEVSADSAARTAGLKRSRCPTCSTRPARRAAAINACAWLTGEALGRFTTDVRETILIGRYAPTRINGEQTGIELVADRFGDGEFASVNCGLVLSFREVGDRVAARQRLVLLLSPAG